MADDLLLDIGGTDLKLGIATPDGFEILERLSIVNLMTWEGEFALYRASELKECLLSLIESGSKKLRGRLFISSQMGGGYLRGINMKDIYSWQSYGGQKIFDKVQNNLSRAEELDLRPGSAIFTLNAAFPELLKASQEIRPEIDSLGGFVADSILGFRSSLRHNSDGYALGGYRVDGTSALFAPPIEFQLPKLTSRVSLLGESSVFPGLKVFTPVGDQQASLLGVNLEEDEIALNIGTGGQVAMRSAVAKHDVNIQIRPYWNDEFLLTLTHRPAGRIVNFYYEIWNKKYQKGFQEFLFLADAGIGRKTTTSLDLEYLTARESLQRVDVDALVESPEIIPSILAVQLSTDYVDSVERLRVADQNKRGLVAAGGLATGFGALREQISEKTGMRFREVDSQETTLEGLSRLSSSVP